MKTFDIDKMRAACRLAAETLRQAGHLVAPGTTTNDIDTFVHNFTVERGGYPAPLNYRGFPRSVCTSVNDVVCHGIPGPYVLKDGDIVNIDVTTVLADHFGDTSATFLVGNVDPRVRHLVTTTQQALSIAISAIRPGLPSNTIGRVVQAVADDSGHKIVREFGGHGIGTRFHTSPYVSHFDTGDDTALMRPGMVFTIEPMLCAGSAETVTDPDGWTVRTRDGSMSAQFEHTVLITEAGCEVLTS